MAHAVGTFEVEVPGSLGVEVLSDDACSGPWVEVADGDMGRGCSRIPLAPHHSRDQSLLLHQTQSFHSLYPHRKTGRVQIGSPCDCSHAGHNPGGLPGASAHNIHCHAPH